MFNSLRARVVVMLLVLAVLPVLVLGAYFTLTRFNTDREAATDFQYQVAQRVAAEIDSLLSQEIALLRTVPNIVNLVEIDPQSRNTILRDIFNEARDLNRLVLLDETGQELVYIARREVIHESQLGDRSSKPEFRVPAAQKTIYFGDIQFDEMTGEPTMLVSVPQIDLRTGELIYILVGELQLRPIWNLVAYETLGEGQDIFVIDQNQQVVAHSNPSVVLGGTRFLLPESAGAARGLQGDDVVLAFSSLQIGDNTLTVVSEQTTDVAYAEAYSSGKATVLVLVLTVIVTTAIGLFGIQHQMRPLARLADVARRIGAGELDARADVEGGEEIEAVAAALNDMAVQLSNLVGSLEARVQDRTRELRLAAEVAQQAATILDPDQLLPQVVELTKENFRLYHAHVYLLDEEGETLVLAAGAGEAGQIMLQHKHHIPLRIGRSLVARAARENRPVIVTDTTTDPHFLPNPLLPDTRSEAAFPLAIGARVLGVLDVQSDRVGYFTADVLDVYRTLANQIAVALDNARLFLEVERVSRHEHTLSVVAEQIQAANSLEELLEVAARELGQALRVPRTAIELKLEPVDSFTGSEAGKPAEPVMADEPASPA